MGVARCRVGSGGLVGGWIAWLPTGLTFGDGGIASPSLGGARPPGRLPGMAGRRRGAGEFMMGTDMGVEARVGRAATEELEETGCCEAKSVWLSFFVPGTRQLTSWAAGSLPWACEEAASAIAVSSAGQGRLSRDVYPNERIVGGKAEENQTLGEPLAARGQVPQKKKKKKMPNDDPTNAAQRRRGQMTERRTNRVTTVLNFEKSADDLYALARTIFKAERGECSHAQFYWSRRGSKASEGDGAEEGITGCQGQACREQKPVGGSRKKKKQHGQTMRRARSNTKRKMQTMRWKLKASWSGA